MAPDAQIAKLLADIEFCHSAKLPGNRLILRAGPHRIGFVRPEFAEILRKLDAEISVTKAEAVLPEALLGQLNELARAAGIPTRAEDFDVRTEVEGPVLGVLDRGALPSFGVIGVGVHLNGLVRRADGLHLWVARRAANKKLDPGKLDHLVAGGVPAGFGPFATLLKEAEEEAGMDEALTLTAQPVARFRYDMERPEGLRRDALYAYDIELPEDFAPRAMDGEVESFELWPLARVKETLCTTDAFKFNVVLVLIDLLLRTGQFEGEAAQILNSALARA